MGKITAVAAATAAAALLLSGCAGAGGGGSTGGGDSGGQITLQVAGFEGGGTELAHIPEINAAFEKAHPNVKIDYQYVEEAQFDQYNNTRLAAGTAADVIMTNPNRVRAWQKQGYLADLSDQAWVQQLLPSVAPFGEVGGKTYAFTQQNIALGLYANEDILKSAGINTVPQTWPDFIEALKTLKAQGKPGLLIANQIGWGAEQMMLGIAANVLKPDWGAGYDSGTTNWNPTWAPVVDQMKELISKGLVDPKLMNGIDEFNVGNSQFAGGKWAFTVMGAWQLADFKKKADFTFSLNPIPGGPAGSAPSGVTFVGSGWAVNNASQHQEAAKDYVAFMASPEQDAEYLKAENCFTTLKNVPSPELADAKPFAAAFSAGHSQVSPVEFLKFTGNEVEMRKVTSSLFNDPSQSTESLLTQLDTNIPKTP